MQKENRRRLQDEEPQLPHWEDGVLRWPDGRPVTNDEAARYFPEVFPQIVPHRPEIERGPQPGRDFDIDDLIDQPPTRRPSWGPSRTIYAARFRRNIRDLLS